MAVGACRMAVRACRMAVKPCRMAVGAYLTHQYACCLPPPPVRPPQVVLPNGEYAPQDYDGAYILSDDTRLLSDGSLKRLNGSVMYPDGSIQEKDGKIYLVDGRVLPAGSSPPRMAVPAFAPRGPLPPGQFPDFPKGTIKLRDGSHKLPNGMVYFPDGRCGEPLSGSMSSRRS